jgi:hypothetical protein
LESDNMKAHFDGARKVLDALLERHWADKACEF